MVVRDAVTADEKETHLLLPDFVKDNGNPNSLSVFVNPVSNNPNSWDKSSVLKLDDQNKNIHYLLCINRHMVDDFNREQTNRANKVLHDYQGAAPDYSKRYVGNIYGKDLGETFTLLNQRFNLKEDESQGRG